MGLPFSSRRKFERLLLCPHVFTGAQCLLKNLFCFRFLMGGGVLGVWCFFFYLCRLLYFCFLKTCGFGVLFVYLLIVSDLLETSSIVS